MSNNTPVLPDTLSDAVSLLDYDGPVFIEGYEDEKGDFEPEPRAARLAPPSHPGEILRDLYLPSVGVSLTQLADQLYVSRRTISMIVNGSRPVTVDMAHRLARALGTTPEFWLRLQTARDTWMVAHTNRSLYQRIQRIRPHTKIP